MQIIRKIFPLAVVALLAACAGTATPSTPEPPVGDPAPPPPGDEVPYGGQWHAVFTAEDGTSFVHALDITTAYSDGQQDGGFGTQQLCTGRAVNPCGEKSDQDTGVSFIGTRTREDGTKPLNLTIYDKSGLKINVTENLATSTDAEGRQVLTGPAIWLNQSGSSPDRTNGTITATNVGASTDEPPLGDPVPNGTLTGSWNGTTTLPTRGTLETGFFLTQTGSQVSGEIFIFPAPGNEVSITLQGAVTSNIITLIAEIPFEGEDLAFAYQGTLSGTTFAGQVTVQPADGSGNSERGTFTTSKSAQK